MFLLQFLSFKLQLLSQLFDVLLDTSLTVNRTDLIKAHNLDIQNAMCLRIVIHIQHHVLTSKWITCHCYAILPQTSFCETIQIFRYLRRLKKKKKIHFKFKMYKLEFCFSWFGCYWLPPLSIHSSGYFPWMEVLETIDLDPRCIYCYFQSEILLLSKPPHSISGWSIYIFLGFC